MTPNPPRPLQKHPRYQTHAPALLVTHAGLQQVTLVDISLGGMFVKTLEPPAVGARVQVRVDVDGMLIDAVGRVVHVLDPARATGLGRPPGAGIEFQQLTPASTANLHRFVVTLSSHAEQHARTAGQARVDPRFVGNTTVRVMVPSPRELQELYVNNISRGGLFVETKTPPPVRAQVDVELTTPDGPLSLRAEVVHTVDAALSHQTGQPMGAGLQFLKLDAVQLATMERYLTGRAPLVKAGAQKMSLTEALEAARVLVAGIEAADGLAAVGLGADATEPAVRERIALLKEVFAASYPDVTAPQAARLVSAQRNLARIERPLLQQMWQARQADTRRIIPVEAGKPPPARPLAEEDPRVMELLHRAVQHEARRELPDARGCLLEAQRLSPASKLVADRLTALARVIDQNTALDLVKTAATYVDTGMRSEAMRCVKEAMRLSMASDVLAGAMGVLVRGGAADDAIRFAERLIEHNPRDARAWDAMAQAAEAAGKLERAFEAAVRLRTLRPDDKTVEARVARLRKLVK